MYKHLNSRNKKNSHLLIYSLSILGFFFAGLVLNLYSFSGLVRILLHVIQYTTKP